MFYENTYMKPLISDKKQAEQFWGIRAFVHRLNNVKLLMKRIIKKDSVEYEVENLRFSIISFEKHFYVMRKKFYDLERRLKDTEKLNYQICPKCGETNKKNTGD